MFAFRRHHSEDEISEPTTAQYRTVPWRPFNVTFDLSRIRPNSFEVRWSGPRIFTEFDRYQVAIGIRRKTPQIIERGADLRAVFTENLRPGHTYQVVVKTVSGSVASWPATGNVTTRPLPILGIKLHQTHRKCGRWGLLFEHTSHRCELAARRYVRYLLGKVGNKRSALPPSWNTQVNKNYNVIGWFRSTKGKEISLHKLRGFQVQDNGR